MMNTSGIIPKKPFAEPDIRAGKTYVVSFTAEGPKTANTPILQIMIRRTKGISLKRIEGTLKKYF